jgi:hypothetical protein
LIIRYFIFHLFLIFSFLVIVLIIYTQATIAEYNAQLERLQQELKEMRDVVTHSIGDSLHAHPHPHAHPSTHPPTHPSTHPPSHPSTHPSSHPPTHTNSYPHTIPSSYDAQPSHSLPAHYPPPSQPAKNSNSNSNLNLNSNYTSNNNNNNTKWHVT